MKKTIISILIITITLLLDGCASKIMESYIGKDVRTAVIDYGPPANAIDLGNGQRAFQWVMHHSYTTPTYISTSGTATTNGYGYANVNNYGYGSNIYGNYNATTWLNSNTVISGGDVIHSKCIYTIFAKWDKNRKAWIITGYKKPPLACE